MDRQRSPLYTAYQACCPEGCWPANTPAQNQSHSEKPPVPRHNNETIVRAESATRNPWRTMRSAAPFFINFSGRLQRDARSQDRLQDRENSVKARRFQTDRMVPPALGDNSEHCTVNTNVLKSKKKPKFTALGRGSNRKQESAEGAKLCLKGNGTIKREECRENIRTESFWGIHSFFSKYNQQATQNRYVAKKAQIIAESKTRFEHTGLFSENNVVDSRIANEARMDSQNQTAASSYVMQSPIQVADKRSRDDLHTTTPHSRYGERSDSEEQEYLLIPQREKVRIEKLWTLSAKDAESESDSAAWEIRIKCQPCHPQQELQMLDGLFIREVSESRMDNHESVEQEEQQLKSIKRTNTLPTATLLGEYRPRASHQVVMDGSRLNGIDEIPEYSRMSVEHPTRSNNHYLKDAKTVHSQDDSCRSKSNEARDPSEVVFRKSVGSELSSLHLYGTTSRPELASNRFDIPSFRKKTQRDQTMEAQGPPTFYVGPLMGLGKHCSWRKAKDIATGFLITLCEIQKDAILHRNLKSRLELEMSWQSRLDHQNVLQFYSAFQDGDKQCLIFEASEETLGSYLRNLHSLGRCLSEREAVSFMKSILAGLQHIHDRLNIAHGAISIDRIVLAAGTSKIFDLSYAEFEDSERSSHLPLSRSSRVNQTKSKQRDCWNAGIVAYCLLAPQQIDFEELVKTYGHDLSLPQLNCSRDYSELVLGLLHGDPAERLTAKQALQLPLLML